jgi:uncharacterized phosphosugar-binding protein
MDVHGLRAESRCMVGIGDILYRCGGLIQTKELWEGAHPLFLRSSRVTDGAAERLEQLSYRYGDLQQPKVQELVQVHKCCSTSEKTNRVQ